MNVHISRVPSPSGCGTTLTWGSTEGAGGCHVVIRRVNGAIPYHVGVTRLRMVRQQNRIQTIPGDVSLPGHRGPMTNDNELSAP